MRRNDQKITVLAGGVGGARLARALASQFLQNELTIIVNIGDDDTIYGLKVSPDLDSVVYTLAGVEGPHGWGRANDSFETMKALTGLGIDTTFQIGDRDLATNIIRTDRLARGETLADITSDIAKTLGVEARVLPASNQSVPTRVQTESLGELSFQEYFVHHQAMPTVTGLEFVGAASATPAPGVVKAISSADVVVIAPSNPILSVWPILAIDSIRNAVAEASIVAAVSPLVGGKPVKGPTAKVMSALGYEVSHDGVASCYDGLLTHMIVDSNPPAGPLEVFTHDTMIDTPERGKAFGAWFNGLWS